VSSVSTIVPPVAVATPSSATVMTLAYAGSSLPLLILIVSGDDFLGGAPTDQVVAQERVPRTPIG
jgi:hypothetical protein